MKRVARGLLPLFILSEAQRSPISGKRVSESLSRLTKGGWRPSPGSVYPILRGLEEEGFLKSVLGKGAGRREVLYSITHAGSKALAHGRRDLIELTDERFKTVMPVAMRVSTGLELTEPIQEMFSLISLVRSRLVSLPAGKRGEALKRVVACYRRMKKELEDL